MTISEEMHHIMAIRKYLGEKYGSKNNRYMYQL